VKKGRHRRFEEARALKRTVEVVVEPCAECGAAPDAEHASWCLATEDLELDDDVSEGGSRDDLSEDGDDADGSPPLGTAGGGSA
jgi:hypothetical protein